MKERIDNDYLKNHIEPIRSSQEKSWHTEEDLGYGDIISHDKKYLSEHGIFKDKVSDAEIVFSYTKPTSEDIQATIHHLDKFKEKKEVESALSEEVLKNIRKIETYDLKNESSHFSVSNLKTDDPVTIYFNVPLASGSGFSRMANTIFLEQDPLSRKGLMVLMHELGHFMSKGIVSEDDAKNYYQSLKKLDYLFGLLPSRRLNQSDASRILKEERDAWAFSLKNLRPFEKDLDLDLDNSLETIHAHCLQTYSDHFRERIKI